MKSTGLPPGASDQRWLLPVAAAALVVLGVSSLLMLTGMVVAWAGGSDVGWTFAALAVGAVGVLLWVVTVALRVWHRMRRAS